MAYSLYLSLQYLPIEGLVAFNKETADSLLGKDNPIFKQHEVATIQGNHPNIFNDATVPWIEYRYCYPKTVGMDFDRMITDMKACVDPTTQALTQLLDSGRKLLMLFKRRTTFHTLMSYTRNIRPIHGLLILLPPIGRRGEKTMLESLLFRGVLGCNFVKHTLKFSFFERIALYLLS
ncbi:hypothetical protein Nepgr_026228 [Nepenthes gracilis]|uniref:Uncharacterized protein n=1 Tax=Nepenthes gracilis TaxID=150966 RepID=A0AAD3T7J3_NEPGR|nr:hypothetical protein Nepgr_026228 [Nepenthes gracilis]